MDKLSRAKMESPPPGKSITLLSSSSSANPDLSSGFGFALSSFVSVTEEQIDTLNNDELALVITKFQKFYTNRKGSDKEDH